MDKNGRAFGCEVPLTEEMTMHTLDASDLKPYPAVVLPQDWPGVCSYYYPQSINVTGNPDWDNMEYVQISLRGDIYEPNHKKDKCIAVEKIVLEY